MAPRAVFRAHTALLIFFFPAGAIRSSDIGPASAHEPDRPSNASLLKRSRSNKSKALLAQDATVVNPVTDAVAAGGAAVVAAASNAGEKAAPVVRVARGAVAKSAEVATGAATIGVRTVPVAGAAGEAIVSRVAAAAASSGGGVDSGEGDGVPGVGGVGRSIGGCLVKVASVVVAIICLLGACVTAQGASATEASASSASGAVSQSPPQPVPSSDERSTHGTAGTTEAVGASLRIESGDSPNFAVLFGCLGAQFLYQASYSIAIPQSYKLTWMLLSDQGGETSRTVVHLLSGFLIAEQHLTYAFVSYLCRYTWSASSDRLLIVLCLVMSLLGSGIFCIGLLAPLGARLTLWVVLLARLVQGFGAGVDYTAKRSLTRHSSPSHLSRYYAYWNVASSCGTGFGPILVFASTCLPNFDHLSVRQQIAVPMLLLMLNQLFLLVSHIGFFPSGMPSKPANTKKQSATVPLTHADRTAKIYTSVFFAFARHMIRSAWEAVSVLVISQRFGFNLQGTTLFVSMFYFFSYPAQVLYAYSQHILRGETWLHVLLAIAAFGTLLLLDADDVSPSATLDAGGEPRSDLRTHLYYYTIGSVLLYCSLAIHAAASDALGVIYADDSDPRLCVESVVFMQGMAKGFMGRLLGPVIGRVSILDSQAGFAMIVIFVLGLCEALTLIVMPVARRRGTAEGDPLVDGVFAPDTLAVDVLTLCKFDEFCKSPRGFAVAQLKHGDVVGIKATAGGIASMLAQDSEVKAAADPRTPLGLVLIAPPFRFVPTVGVLLTRSVQQQLLNTFGISAPICSLRRKAIAGTAVCSSVVAKARGSETTSGEGLFVSDADAEGLAKRLCILIDDVAFDKRQAAERWRFLAEHGVASEGMLNVCAVTARPELLHHRAHVSRLLDEILPSSAEAMQAIMEKEGFEVNVQIAQRILELPEQEFQALCTWLQAERRKMFDAIAWTAYVESLKGSERMLTRSGLAASAMRNKVAGGEHEDDGPSKQ